ncbi:hypothetical protein L6164_026488 [Bauhinia variegata]|uniref:Uncharacterized protein n=1 Tax=Bauhinia variegata TaxID=167791 RepID=A0ACB9LQP8_BAUVA|nr:hypothetical protein L6164_026488 [Bauhinia variegata]
MIPNMASYSSTVGVLCRDGNWKEAEILLGLMTNSGFRKQKLWPRNFTSAGSTISKLSSAALLIVADMQGKY